MIAFREAGLWKRNQVSEEPQLDTEEMLLLHRKCVFVQGDKVGRECVTSSFYLVVPLLTDIRSRKEYQLWDWLEDLRKMQDCRKSACPFFFPDNDAGPDLVFAMKSPGVTSNSNDNHSRLVLFSIQLKTSKKFDYKDAMQRSSLYEAFLYSGSKGIDEKRRKLEKELENWTGNTFVKVLFWTGGEKDLPSNYKTTLTGPTRARAQKRKEGDNKRRRKQWKEALPIEYFLSCYAPQIGSFFGEDFNRVVTALRSVDEEDKDEL